MLLPKIYFFDAAEKVCKNLFFLVALLTNVQKNKLVTAKRYLDFG